MTWKTYLPATLLLVGAVTTWGVGTPRPMPLVQPLEQALPNSMFAFAVRDVPLREEEEQATGATNTLNREYDIGGALGPMSLYVGYHATQRGDKRMHSPDVCLPGAGWTPVQSGVVTIPVGDSTVTVNRYEMQHGMYRILVYYWFQGRGRVTAGQLEVSLRNLQDALFKQRDEEALVRIVVPIDPHNLDASVGATGVPADTLARQFASGVIPALQQALPPL